MHGYYSELQWNICLIQLSGFIILHFHSMGNVKSVFRLNNSRGKKTVLHWTKQYVLHLSI